MRGDDAVKVSGLPSLRGAVEDGDTGEAKGVLGNAEAGAGE